METQFVIETTLRCSDIFAPQVLRSPMMEPEHRFFATFALTDLPSELAALIPKAIAKSQTREREDRRGLISVSNQKRPVIVDSSGVVSTRLRLLAVDASDHNLGMDALVIGTPVKLLVDTWERHDPRRYGNDFDKASLALRAVQVDPDAMRENLKLILAGIHGVMN